ncbi:LysR substrate-binding domain-containing protein [Serratia ureilytica]
MWRRSRSCFLARSGHRAVRRNSAAARQGRHNSVHHQEVGEAMTIIGLVSAGLGVSILPASFARVRVDGVRYLPLAEPDATTEVWLVHHRRRPLTAAAQALMALMLK